MFGEAEEDPEDDGNNNDSNNNNESLGISPLEFSLSFIFEKEEDDKESSDISTLLESSTNPIMPTLSSNNTFCSTTINTTESSATATVMTFPAQQVKADFLLPYQWDSLTTVIQRGKLVKVSFWCLFSLYKIGSASIWMNFYMPSFSCCCVSFFLQMIRVYYFVHYEPGGSNTVGYNS
jgi:hypothetical protein